MRHSSFSALSTLDCNISLIHFLLLFRLLRPKIELAKKSPEAFKSELGPIGTCLIKKTCGSTKPPISVRNHVPAGNSIHYRLPCPGTRWTHPPALLFWCRTIARILAFRMKSLWRDSWNGTEASYLLPTCFKILISLA